MLLSECSNNRGLAFRHESATRMAEVIIACAYGIKAVFQTGRMMQWEEYTVHSNSKEKVNQTYRLKLFELLSSFEHQLRKNGVNLSPDSLST